jgi:hypothetical protein
MLIWMINLRSFRRKIVQLDQGKCADFLQGVGFGKIDSQLCYHLTNPTFDDRESGNPFGFFFRFIWKRTSTLIGGSEVTIQWEIPLDTPPGTYRIRHFGHYKQFLGGIHPYSGNTPSFQVED